MVAAEGRVVAPSGSHVKVGDLTVENDLLDRALTKAGWLSLEGLSTGAVRC